MKRRLAAFAASLFLINLNVVVVDRACGSRHHAKAQAHEHAGHEHHAPAKSPAREAPAKCCDAISSCGVTMSLATDVAIMDDSPSVVRALLATIDSPSSLSRAPEPPPPKA